MVDLWSGVYGNGGEPLELRRERGEGGGERKRESILVVDDDTSILDTVSSILTQEGYSVVSAASGEEALAAIDREPPSLILLDMRMPVMDGWAVARALRDRGVAVPIVVMTAAESAKRWADEIQAEGYLAKPFGLDDLLSTVDRHRRSGGKPH
ncbi:MAG TPA: response regulator [Candidatus Limnocylindria bacterium]|jgi:CheY-like chemotaxis protein|nr:response regulator [Candidatus Limnocylindria bacterium]